MSDADAQPHESGVFVIDETGYLEDGMKTDHVPRQYLRPNHARGVRIETPSEPENPNKEDRRCGRSVGDLTRCLALTCEPCKPPSAVTATTETKTAST